MTYAFRLILWQGDWIPRDFSIKEVDLPRHMDPI